MYNDICNEIEVPHKENVASMFNQIQSNTSELLKGMSTLTETVKNLTIEVHELKKEVMLHHDKLLIIRNDKEWVSTITKFSWHNIFKILILFGCLYSVYLNIKKFIPILP